MTVSSIFGFLLVIALVGIFGGLAVKIVRFQSGMNRRFDDALQATREREAYQREVAQAAYADTQNWKQKDHDLRQAEFDLRSADKARQDRVVALQERAADLRDAEFEFKKGVDARAAETRIEEFGLKKSADARANVAASSQLEHSVLDALLKRQKLQGAGVSIPDDLFTGPRDFHAASPTTDEVRVETGDAQEILDSRVHEIPMANGMLVVTFIPQEQIAFATLNGVPFGGLLEGDENATVLSAIQAAAKAA